MERKIIIGLILAALAPSAALADNCRQFFVQRQVAYVAPVYAYAQPVIYQAGLNIENDALAEKVARIVVQKLQTAQPVRQQQVVTPSVFSSCVRCHSGPKPAGGLTLDGQTAVDCNVYWRWGEMAGLGENIPPEMDRLMRSMTPEQKGAINTAILRLPRLDQQSPSPQPEQIPPAFTPADRPPPPPPTRPGDLQ